MEQKPAEQYSEKELQEAMEIRTKEWETFIASIKDNPEKSTTNKDLYTAIEFISEDVHGLMQMCQMVYKNNEILAHNFQQLVAQLQGKSSTAINKTKSGIILP